MGMSVQKKFILGLISFTLLVFIVGFIIGYFARLGADDRNGCGAKNGGDDTSGRLFEEKALELISGQKIRHYLKYFANQSHLSEENNTCAQALYIKKEWDSFGLDTVQLKRYDVLLTYPKRPSELTLTDTNGNVVYSSIVIQNFTDEDNFSRTAFPFSSHSASGVVTGKLLYVNYARESDFKYLEDRSISCTGKILLARYGKIFERDKVINARKWIAKGLLLYTDSADNSTISNWYPSSTAQGGGSWMNRGDPLTPGYPASAGIYRQSTDEISQTKILVQPISPEEAEKLFRILNNTNVPKHWQEGIKFSDGIEMDPSDTRNVTISVNLSLIKRTVCDVVGTIKGKLEPDRYVLLGSRRPSGGTAVIMEITRILLSIREKGWVPRRSIKICSWGAGEYGNIGIVEWLEENGKILESRAVAYINADNVVKGNFNVLSSPLLMKTVLEAAKKVSSPSAKSTTMYDEWMKTKRNESGKQSGNLSGNKESGCSAFAYSIGVPCVDLGYQSDKASGYRPVHYPLHDTPEFLKYYSTLAQVWLRVTFDIAGSLYIPFDVVSYSGALYKFATDLSVNYNGTLKENNITLDFFLSASQGFLDAAKLFKKCLDTQDKNDVLKVRMLNDRLLQLDRAFINKEGLPGSPFVRQVALAPSYFDTEPVSQFPGIMDSIHIASNSGRRKDWDRVKKQISMVIHAFRSAVLVLNPVEF